MREQVVCQRYRLGLLQVRVTRQVRIARCFGLAEQGPLKLTHEVTDLIDRRKGPQPNIGGDLIVAAPTRVHLGARGFELSNTPFDGGMNVFVARLPLHPAVFDFALDLVERSQDAAELNRGE